MSPLPGAARLPGLVGTFGKDGSPSRPIARKEIQMKIACFELWIAMSAVIAAILKPKAWLDLPINHRLMASSNAISRVR